MKIIKMRPSHIPVLKAIFEKTMSVLEFGGGVNSTPLLSTAAKFVCYEHGKEWAEKLASDGYPGVKYLPIASSIKYNTYPQALNAKQWKSICHKYVELSKNHEAVDLAFIDSYASTRAPALSAFWSKAKVVVVHDTQNPKYRIDDVVNRKKITGVGSRVTIRCKPELAGEPWTDVYFMDDVVPELVVEKIRNHAEYAFSFEVVRVL